MEEVKFVLKFKYMHHDKPLYYPISAKNRNDAIMESLSFVAYSSDRNYVIEWAELEKHVTTITTEWELK